MPGSGCDEARVTPGGPALAPHRSQLAPWAPWVLRELALDPVVTCWGLWLGGFVLPRGSLRSFWNSPRTGNFHPSPQGRSRQDRPRAGEGAGRGEDPVGCRPSRAGCPGPTTQPWAQLHTLGQGSVWAPNSTRPCAGSPQNGGVGPLLPQAYTWVPPKAFMDGGPGLWGSGPPSRTQITGWVASTLGLQGLAWTSARLHVGPLLPSLWEHHFCQGGCGRALPPPSLPGPTQHNGATEA